MAVRWRKYFKECKGRRETGDRYGKVVSKGVDCNGKRSRLCPEGISVPCGGWSIDYRESDGRWVSKVFPGIGKTQAQELYEEIRSNLRRSLFGLPSAKKVPTLKEYSQTYLEMCRGMKENTAAMKRRAVGVLIRYLGEYSLDKITPFIVEKFRLERKERDGVQDSSLNIDVQQLSHIFSTAINAEIIDSNPCQKVKSLKTSQVKDRILFGDEIARILDMPEGKDKLMILTALFTGARLNEVLNLSWNDIDFAKGIITVFQSKTSKTISIPLADVLKTALEAYGTHLEGDKVSRPEQQQKRLWLSIAGISAAFSGKWVSRSSPSTI